MSVKQVILSAISAILMCLLVAGAFQAPALAASSNQVLYSGTVVDNGNGSNSNPG